MSTLTRNSNKPDDSDKVTTTGSGITGTNGATASGIPRERVTGENKNPEAEKANSGIGQEEVSSVIKART